MAVLQPFFSSQARLFRAGQTNIMALSYVQPLVITDGDSFVRVRMRSAIEAALSAHRDCLNDQELKHLRIAVLEEDFATRVRSTAEVEWFNPGQFNERRRLLRARIYISRHRGIFCITMLEFLETAHDAVPDCYFEQGDWPRAMPVKYLN